MNRRGFLGTVAVAAAGGCCPKPLTLTEVATFMRGVESAPVQNVLYHELWHGCIASWCPVCEATGLWAREIYGTAEHTNQEGQHNMKHV